jgi:hypothetical protein
LQISQNVREVFFSVSIPSLVIGKLFYRCFNFPRMPLVFGLNLNSVTINNTSFSFGRIN